MFALIILAIVDVIILMRTGQAPVEDGKKWTVATCMPHSHPPHRRNNYCSQYQSSYPNACL